MDKLMKVVCCAFPSGETYWIPAEKGPEYIRQVIDKWKNENNWIKDTKCTMGFIEIVMLEDKYNSIDAIKM